MKSTLLYILLFVSGIAVMLYGCKEDCPCDDPTNPVCDNYDPCFGKRTVNTFFKVRRSYGGFPPPGDWCDLTPSDTFNGSTIHFSIPDGGLGNQSYEWQIGSEAETRKGEAFEVDFSDYLRDNGWETWIPITLNIRTPLNECLSDPNDTLVTVTRELFFTETNTPSVPTGKYKGYFTNEPDNEVTIEFLSVDKWLHKGIDFPVFLTVGLPNIDSFMFPQGCPFDGCVSYKQRITRFSRTRNCETPGGVNLAALSNNLLQSEVIKPDGTFDKLRHIWVFDKPTGIERFEFIGEKIE